MSHLLRACKSICFLTANRRGDAGDFGHDIKATGLQRVSLALRVSPHVIFMNPNNLIHLHVSNNLINKHESLPCTGSLKQYKPEKPHLEQIRLMT